MSGEAPASSEQHQQSVDAALGADALASEAKLAEFAAQVQEANDRALRAQAELDNARKRMKREFDEERKYLLLPLVRDLLSVADNLERALEAAGQAGDAAGLLTGVKMVSSQLLGVLGQHQCVRIDAEGAVFDPAIHQAVAQEPSGDIPAGSITRAHQAGYKLHDRVVRPAMVVVSTGPAAS